MAGGIGSQFLDLVASVDRRLRRNIQYPIANVIGPVSHAATVLETNLICDATAGAVTITLPTAVGISGMPFTVKKIDATANTVTVDPAGAETIDGAATYVLSSQWRSVTFISNGVGWDVTSEGQVPASSKEYATVVVDPNGIAGVNCDYTTLTGALADAEIVAEGGLIDIREGTVAATGGTYTPPAKPIVIRGSGHGTILAVTGNNSLFSLSTGFEFHLEDVGYLGDSTPGQRFLDVSVAPPTTDRDSTYTVKGCTGTLIETVVKTSVYSKVTMRDCTYLMPPGGVLTPKMWAGSGQLIAYNVQCYDVATAIQGGFTGTPDLKCEHCYFGVQSGGTFGTLLSLDSSFGGAVVMGSDGYFKASYFSGLLTASGNRNFIERTFASVSDITLAGNQNTVLVTGGANNGTALGPIKVTGDKNRIIGAFLDRGGLAGIPAGIWIIGGDDTIITGVYSEGAFATADILVEDAQRTVISGCQLQGSPPIKETGTSDRTVVTGCLYYSPPVFVGARSRLENQNVKNITNAVSPYTMTIENRTITADASAGAITVDLPTAANSKWMTFTVKKTDATANAVTVDPNGAETIDGAATFALAVQYESITFQSDGTTWWII